MLLWWCHISLILHYPCSLVLVSMHLKKQSSLTVFADWLCQGKPSTSKLNQDSGWTGWWGFWAGWLSGATGRSFTRHHGLAVEIDHTPPALISPTLECIVAFLYPAPGEKDNVYRAKCVKSTREKTCKAWVGRHYINTNYNISMIALLFAALCMRPVSP